MPNSSGNPAKAIGVEHIIPFNPDGTLVIVGGGSLPDEIRKFFVDSAGGEKAKILIVTTASSSADSEPDEYWIEDWTPFNPGSVSILHTRDRSVADSSEFVARINEATGIWISGGDQSRLAEAYGGTRAEKAFENVVRRGGVIGGTSAGAAICSKVMIAGGRQVPTMGTGFDLLPFSIVDQHFSERNRIGRLRVAVEQNPDCVGLGIDESTAVIISGRSMRVAGMGAATVVMSPTPHAPALEFRIEPGRIHDWMTFVRQSRERHCEEFPGENSASCQFTAGSLVIVGGGRMGDDIVRRFVELAGGENAKIVILPTATSRPGSRSVEEGLFQRVGVASTHVLPQTEFEQINSPEYLEILRNATGIWFGGGRQWNFVDHYEGTAALQEMHNLLSRGGVIGGSSAGASIMGELLIRGAPVGNHIMVQDGYRRGFGFLPGTGIDQHFTQRNRMKDLRETIRRFPSVTGLGIDESTALVVTVEGAEVLGAGSVYVLRSGDSDGSGVESAEFKSSEKITLDQIFRSSFNGN